MQSRAQTVTEYMREVPNDRLDALTELREMCLQTLSGYKETMEYGMPTYSHANHPQVAWNSQKNYISLYLMHSGVIKKYKPQLKNLDVGKSCIRYKKADQMNFNLIRQMLADTAAAEPERG